MNLDGSVLYTTTQGHQPGSAIYRDLSSWLPTRCPMSAKGLMSDVALRQRVFGVRSLLVVIGLHWYIIDQVSSPGGMGAKRTTVAASVIVYMSRKNVAE